MSNALTITAIVVLAWVLPGTVLTALAMGRGKQGVEKMEAALNRSNALLVLVAPGLVLVSGACLVALKVVGRGR